MIKTQESMLKSFCLGNYIYSDSKVAVVTADILKELELGSELYSPIRVTESFLTEMMGFRKEVTPMNKCKFVIGDFQIWKDLNDKYFHVCFLKKDLSIRYVHEVQNIYKFCTGLDLDILM